MEGLQLSSFLAILSCGILGWMFVGLHYEDVSLVFAKFCMIDR